jgi:hypothetical protein
MRNLQVLGCILFAALALQTQAQTTPPADGSAPSQGTDQADELITNARMRADTGSLSKWSFKSTTVYYGGPIDNPGSAVRPNISGSSTVGNTLSELVSFVGAKYRLNTTDSFVLQLGLATYAPFNSRGSISDPGLVSAYNRNHTLQAFDPTLVWFHVYKLGNMQSYLDTEFSTYTRSSFIDQGYVTQLNSTDVSMYEFGKSGLSLGFFIELYWNTFNKSANTLVGTAPNQTVLGSQQGEYEVQTGPILEYAFSDNLTFRTLLQFDFQHNRDQGPALAYNTLYTYQSVGLGINVTRDIYFYPNIQFIPVKCSLNNTNVALQANINLF